MLNRKMGIYAKKDKTFYYLETGINHISNEIDRIKKTLFQRCLIEVDFENSILIVRVLDKRGRIYTRK